MTLGQQIRRFARSGAADDPPPAALSGRGSRQRAALPAGENVPGADRAFRAVVGNAIGATHGVLRIDGKDLDRKPVGEDAEEVSFVTKLKKGSYQLAPVFQIPEGELGAYYVVVTSLASE